MPRLQGEGTRITLYSEYYRVYGKRDSTRMFTPLTPPVYTVRVKVNIQKSSGCNHVICTRCQMHLCFRCGKDITDVGYGHFREHEAGSDPFCRGKLFGDDNVMVRLPPAHLRGGRQRRPPPRVRGAAAGGAAGGATGPPVRKRCVCGVWLEKNGTNNRMSCWNCQKNVVCMHCGRTLKRNETKHFGNVAQGRCPQHSRS